MSKTTALTFAAAIVLFVASLALADYEAHDAAAQRYAAEGETHFIISDADDMELDSWKKASGITTILALSVFVAGVMLWVGDEEPPHAQQASILRLDERAARPVIIAPIPYESAQARVHESGARPSEAESVTPLERVIRGY